MLHYTLSNRMTAVANLVPKGTTVCDIGCDHGFVAIYLVQKGICPEVIAMDVHEGPLLRAREHVESAGLSRYIETRLSDGLEKLKPGETEGMIAAGMGGRLTVKILTDYPEKRESLRFLILQPQSEVALVRRFLRESGFVIRKEDMVWEDGKFYPVILSENESSARAAVRGSAGGDGGAEYRASAGTETRMERCEEPESGFADRDAEQGRYRESLEDEFGPCLLRDRHPALSAYLDWWEGQQKKILNQVLTYPERRGQVEAELARIRDARGWKM